MVHAILELGHLLSFNISVDVPAGGTGCGKTVSDGTEIDNHAWMNYVYSYYQCAVECNEVTVAS